MKKFLLIFLLVLLAGCERVGTEVFVGVTPMNELTFDSAQSTTVLTVTSSGRWYVSEVQECQVC